MPERAISDGEQSPYFFLSYAHTPKQSYGDRSDPDRWVVKLFKQLCDHVMNMTDLPHGSRAGFMDHELCSGDDWPYGLADAVATCRVFVPLYSERYFASKECGKEWFGFSQRILSYKATHGSEPLDVIVPALWVPIRESDLPQVARNIQYASPSFGERYEAHGLYGFIKLSRYRSDYQVAVYELARRIVEVGRKAQVAAAARAEYESWQNAFGSREGRSDARRLKVTVVSSSVGDLLNGRDRAYYGATAREWNPYHPDSARPIADHAADLVSIHGYLPEVGTLTEHLDSLIATTPPDCPGLLLVDAWAAMDTWCAEALARLDALDHPWVSVLVPWNGLDVQTVEADAELRDRLEAAIPHKLAEVRRAFRTTAGRITTLKGFEDALLVMMRAVEQHYFKYARAYPPTVSTTERPRLVAPVSMTGVTEPLEMQESCDDRQQ